MKGRILAIVVLLVGGWLALELLQYQAGLGRYAESPQRVVIQRDGTAIVGGGQAGVKYLGDQFRRAANLQVRCKDVVERFVLRPGEETPETCGVVVELVEMQTGDRVAIEARWGVGETGDSE